MLGLTPTIKTSVVDATYAGRAKVTVQVGGTRGAATGTVTIGGVTGTLSGGGGTITLQQQGAGAHGISVNYNGGPVYHARTTSTTVKIAKGEPVPPPPAPKPYPGITYRVSGSNGLGQRHLLHLRPGERTAVRRPAAMVDRCAVQVDRLVRRTLGPEQHRLRLGAGTILHNGRLISQVTSIGAYVVANCSASL